MVRSKWQCHHRHVYVRHSYVDVESFTLSYTRSFFESVQPPAMRRDAYKWTIDQFKGATAQSAEEGLRVSVTDLARLAVGILEANEITSTIPAIQAVLDRAAQEKATVAAAAAAAADKTMAPRSVSVVKSASIAATTTVPVAGALAPQPGAVTAPAAALRRVSLVSLPPKASQ
jgi:hypothetical protein